MDEGREGSNSGLQNLPSCVIECILSKLDVASICSARASSTFLNYCASQTLSSLHAFHILDASPTPEVVHHLMGFNEKFKSVKLDCAQLGDSSIEYLAKPHLEELCLQHCDNFSEKLFTEIGEKCANLRVLSLELHWLEDRPENFIYGDGFNKLLLSCSKLESLRLIVDGSIIGNNEFSVTWKLATPILKVLELGYVLERDIKEILSSRDLKTSRDVFGHSPFKMKESISYPNLQKLSLNLDMISDSLVAIILKSLPCLTHLDLRDEPIVVPSAAFDLTNWGIQQICNCSKLQHLSIVRSQGYCSASFKQVNDLGFLLLSERCLLLESFRLGGFCRITDAGFRAVLHACTNLQKLELLCASQLTDLVFHDISATTLSLSHVALQSCNLITDFSIVRLTYCRNLESLDLRGCKTLSDDSLKSISMLFMLRSLLLNATDISDMGLSFLGKGKAPLVTLSLRNCKRLTDQGITALFDGYHLTNTLRNLDFSRIPNMSDNAILALVKGGVYIVELRIRECHNITDTSIMALASMKFEGQGYGSTLKLLDIFNCSSITKLGVSWFRKPYFPRLRWLSLGWYSHGYCVRSLLKQRPLLQIVQDGRELDWGQKELREGFYSYDVEEEGELEQWLRDQQANGTDEVQEIQQGL